ncbi:alpha-ribazole phosphatase [Vibrio sp. JPW-9-11-11]|uniref:histidine phosphatase family protein n=1 Tax=Vibrio sp. JPW-9-11-11 TaxID=1416532 RepID=UPI001593A688|nr:histidine phosphatase family protein [Vibrio sp. JPW-9-11-11]NVD06565.1 alpha-ribazole phosphatase [Vibrio sp. JPW-9-11-11]
MKTVNVYLLRHGKTVGAPALYGHSDVGVSPLTQAKICQALQTESLIFQQMQTSPLKRCRELAQTLLDTKPSLSLEIVPAWQEMAFGQFDGVPFDSLKQQWPQLEAFWQNPASNTLPGGESLEGFYQRVSEQWQTLTQRIEQDTLIVCHGGTIRMILAHVLKLDWRNASLYSSLSIGHQSITHIQISYAERHHYRVCCIGRPLAI